jgi:hypothetical protein
VARETTTPRRGAASVSMALAGAPRLPPIDSWHFMLGDDV